MKDDIKKGDYVGFVFAQPGNDVTYLVVVDINGDKVECYDPWIDGTFTVSKTKLWILSEKTLKSKVDHYKFGEVTVEDGLKKPKNWSKQE